MLTCHIDGFTQDCSYSSSLAIELLQSFLEPSVLSETDYLHGLMQKRCDSIANTL